jgi:hypothetical protein
MRSIDLKTTGRSGQIVAAPFFGMAGIKLKKVLAMADQEAKGLPPWHD